MKEFPRDRYAIVTKLRQSSTVSTFVVKPHVGSLEPQILKIYSRANAIVNIRVLEDDLSWQRGVVHPYLMGLFDAGVSGKGNLFTVRPFSENGFDLLSADSIQIKQLLDAVCFLHEHSRPHGRIKPSNLFLVDGNLRLADLRLMNCDNASEIESIRFTAPEVLAGETPTVESDYYSLGAVLYRIYARQDPFDDLMSENLKAKYLYLKVPSIRLTDGMSESVGSAIGGLLHKNPRRRASAFGELLREFPFESSSVIRAPFIGRRETIELLHSRCTEKDATKLRICLIEGDAGIGKTRLIEELQFRCSFRNTDIFTTSCTGHDENGLAPFARLINEMLRRKCGASPARITQLLGNFAEGLSPLIGAYFQGPAVHGVAYSAERLGQEVIGLISSISRANHLTLCLEDIDQAEPATLGLLKQISYRASDLNLFLILTCQDSSAGTLLAELEAMLAGAFNRITIDRLTKSETTALIRFLDPNVRSRSQTQKRAGGNPLWLLKYSKNETVEPLVARIRTLIQEEMKLDVTKVVHALALHRDFASVDLLAKVVASDTETVAQSVVWLRKIGAVHEFNHMFELRLESLRSAFETDLSARAKKVIHRAFYSVLDSSGYVQQEVLAEHAFRGELWDRAAIHYTALVRAAVKRGDNAFVVGIYGKLKILLRRVNQELPVEVEIGIATCLARSGNSKLAEEIFERLLAKSENHEDERIRLSLVNRGNEIDRIRLEHKLKQLRQAIKSAQFGRNHPARLFSNLCISLVRAGDLIGAADSLQDARNALSIEPDETASRSATAAETFLLMNRGDFQGASDLYRTLSSESSDVRASLLMNRGVCLEHLGSIRSAFVVQQRAYRLTAKTGYLVGQLLCLANLGGKKLKLGEYKEARKYLDQARQLAAEYNLAASGSFSCVEIEQAGLDSMEGQHFAALQRLRKVRDGATIYKVEQLELKLLEWEIRFDIGEAVKPSDIERLVAEASWSESPLYKVQLALLRSRIETEIVDTLKVLVSALECANKSSLLFEKCRLELEIAARLRETDTGAARRYAEDAFRIARKNGYRPLLARAQLLRGLCSGHEKEREHYFELSYKLASEIGIPELVSESAYRLGVLYQDQKKYAVAREHLANSTRITAEIAQQSPVRFQTKYLAVLWRKDARKRYGECLRDQPSRLIAAEPDISPRKHSHFQALYKVSIAAASAQSVDSFLREILSVIGDSRECIVAMLKSTELTAWHSPGIAVADELRKRVQSIAEKAKGQARFDALERWIPFRSLQYSGGIYVRDRKRNKMGEDEMEFFTILGTFVSSSLDQIHHRMVLQPITVATTNFHGIVGRSRPTLELCAHIETIANNNATVLIQGETGTGKELVARAIHKLSARAKSPFIAIDCGAIPESLIESELFGSKRGSFTGAVADRPGVFEAANGGTLFLDEISNMNPGMQAKLLRAIQEREIRRVGETRTRHVDVRLIAASNTDLKRLVAEGVFRQDLLFRLNVIEVNLPPLRTRREDIPMLAAHFLNQLNSIQKASKVFGAEALHPLLAYSFPGNIRELQNCIERGFFTARGQTISTIPVEPRSGDVSTDEVRKWFSDLAEGRRNFWTAIHDRYKQRDIPREKVVALVDLGLRTTHGSYKELASLFRIDHREYRRLMDFLRRNNCLLDFRPYRKVASIS